MSSSQGNNAGTSGLTGYTYSTNSMGDASEYTKRLKEKLVYQSYNGTPPSTTRPAWMEYGNQFRLTFLFGQFKCQQSPSCTGLAFNDGGVKGPLVF